VDWGHGRYEQIAASLLPAAETLVERAAPRPGEHVLDLGCGTGNVALIAAARGSRVTGVDPSERLLEVAAEEAARRGLRASFVEGDAAGIPVVRGSVDVLISCFGVIFAPDPEEAAEEIARAVGPQGRVALSAWIPDGPLGAVMKVGRRDAQPASAPFAWHDRAALEPLLAPHGFGVELERQTIAFTAESAEALFDRDVDPHPLWAGDAAARDHALEILTKANEDPDAFRATSSYVVVTARRR
jgi:SAM-dependent methyltransferase